MSRLSAFLFKGIREASPDRAAEGRSLAGLFFLLTASAYIFKAVKISLFLRSQPLSRLPFAYLITAVVMGVVVTLNTRLLRTMKRRPYILGSLAFFAASLVLFRLTIMSHAFGLLILYWLWSDIFLAMTVTQFWILVGDIFPPREAKRMVSSLVKAGLLGGSLRLAAVFAPGLAAGDGEPPPRRLGAPAGGDRPGRDGLAEDAARHTAGGTGASGAARLSTDTVGFFAGLKALLGNRYLALLSGAMLAAVTAATLLDFQFTSVLKIHIAGADERTAFLGMFFTGLLVVSFLLQSVLMHRVLRTFGLKAAILVTPTALLLGVVAVVAWSRVSWAPWPGRSSSRAPTRA